MRDVRQPADLETMTRRATTGSCFICEMLKGNPDYRHRLARVLKRQFEAERIYVLSLGSQAANAHLHVHVAPLPRGVPLAEQQYHALMAEHGVLQIADDEMAAMAQQIGDAYRAAE